MRLQGTTMAMGHMHAWRPKNRYDPFHSSTFKKVNIMSSSKDYIPGNASQFNTFQANLSTQVSANAPAWNIPAIIATDLSTRSVAFGLVYAPIVNEETRTRQQMLAYNAFRKSYDAFLRSFCQSFLTNNVVIPIDQRKALGLNPRGLNPPSKRTKITTSPIVKLVPMGGGEVKFMFKVEASNKRTGRHPESNGVNVYYRFLPINAAVPAPPVPVPPPANQPQDGAPDTDAKTSDELNGIPTDGFEHYFSTKANFTKQLGLSNIGKVLHVYAQWVNTTDPGLSSTFSMVSTVVVS